MSKTVRAKFECNSVEPLEGGGSFVKMSAVTRDNKGNEDFQKYTPYGNVEIGISEETPAASFFEQGKEYYLDFKEASSSEE